MVMGGGRLPAGDLIHRITIEVSTPTKNDLGEEVESWATHATRWALITAVSGGEKWQADGLDSEVTHTVDLRYLATVTPRMRVTHDGRVFNIGAVLRGPRGADMKMLCTENAG